MKIDELAHIWSRYPILWSPHVSGDGKWLAWTWTGLTEIGEVWIAPTDGSKAPERLTYGQDHYYARSLNHDGSKIVLARLRHHISRAWACARHAHIKGTIVSEREAALGLVELHGRDAEIEDNAVDQIVAMLRGDRGEMGEAILRQRKPAMTISNKIGGLRERAGIAIDGDHMALRGGENRLRQCPRLFPQFMSLGS